MMHRSPLIPKIPGANHVRCLAVLACGLAASGAALAQTPAAQSAHSFTGNVGIVSDYRFRGISQTYKQPALQGGFDYAHTSGLYLGSWLSSVSGNLYPNGSGLEWDLYGGYKFEPVKDLGLDVGVLHYYYPGARYYNASLGASGNRYDNTELYLGASYKWFSAKYSHAISDYFGIKSATYGGYCGFNSNGAAAAAGCIAADPGGSRGSSYLDLNANFEIFEKTTLGFHAGHAAVKNYGALSYTDYKLSLTRDFGWATLGVAFVSTNASQNFYRYGPAGLYSAPQGTTENKDPSRGTLVLSIGKTF